MQEWPTLWQGLALLLAFGAGWGIGRGVPTWRADSFKDLGSTSACEVPGTARGGLAPGGCLGLPDQLAYLRVSYSQVVLLCALALVLAFYCAALGWPPEWLNPLKTHPAEFLCITIFQRWIWYTLGTALLGATVGGALALRLHDWF